MLGRSSSRGGGRFGRGAATARIAAAAVRAAGAAPGGFAESAFASAFVDPFEGDQGAADADADAGAGAVGSASSGSAGAASGSAGAGFDADGDVFFSDASSSAAMFDAGAGGGSGAGAGASAADGPAAMSLEADDELARETQAEAAASAAFWAQQVSLNQRAMTRSAALALLTRQVVFERAPAASSSAGGWPCGVACFRSGLLSVACVALSAEPHSQLHGKWLLDEVIQRLHALPTA
jgi:hypothetical protein